MIGRRVFMKKGPMALMAIGLSPPPPPRLSSPASPRRHPRRCTPEDPCLHLPAGGCRWSEYGRALWGSSIPAEQAVDSHPLSDSSGRRALRVRDRP